MKRVILFLATISLVACNEQEEQELSQDSIAPAPAAVSQPVQLMIWNGDMDNFKCFLINNTVYCKGNLQGAFNPEYTPFVVSSASLGLYAWIDGICTYISNASTQPFSRNPGPAAYCWSFKKDPGTLPNSVSPATNANNGSLEVSFGYNPTMALDYSISDLLGNTNNLAQASGDYADCTLTGLRLSCPDFEIDLIQ